MIQPNIIDLNGKRHFGINFCVKIIRNYILEKKGVIVNINTPDLRDKKERELFEKMSAYALSYYDLI